MPQYDTVRVESYSSLTEAEQKNFNSAYIVSASRSSMANGFEEPNAWKVESVSINGNVGIGVQGTATFEKEPHGISVEIVEYENGEYSEAEITFSDN